MKSNEMDGACDSIGRGEVHTGFDGEPEGKRQLWRPRLRWEDNIKTHLKEIDDSVDWIDLAQDRDRQLAGGWIRQWAFQYQLLKTDSAPCSYSSFHSPFKDLSVNTQPSFCTEMPIDINLQHAVTICFKYLNPGYDRSCSVVCVLVQCFIVQAFNKSNNRIRSS
jgi:hypothetical protein